MCKESLEGHDEYEKSEYLKFKHERTWIDQIWSMGEFVDNLSIMSYQRQWQEALPLPLHTEQHTRWQQAMFDPQTASSEDCPIVAALDIWWYHAQELLQKSSFTRLLQAKTSNMHYIPEFPRTSYRNPCREVIALLI